MPRSSVVTDADVVIKFGGGVNTSASDEDILEREAAEGENYRLDSNNRELKPRLPFDLLDTTPDTNQIRGMINLVKVDGTSEILVQTSGGNVYKYTASGFDVTPVATGINVNAQLRGRIEHNWGLTDEVIVTDLNLNEHVKTWDGTSLANISDGLSGDFKAKYAFVSKDRAWYANVEDNGTKFPHLIVGSAVENFESLSTTNKPSTAIGASDPFFMTAPDLRAINGLVEAYGRVVISTRDGQIFRLTGSSSQDFEFTELFPRSAATGDEGLTFAGNDIVYGRGGRIESLLSTEQFGDVQSDDLSRWIKDDIATFKDWRVVYNARTQNIVFFEDNQSLAWVFHKPIAETSDLSPWVKYTTEHAFGFSPSCVMNMIDPDDGLEYIYMGDGSGNFYKLEGTTDGGDAGTTDIISFFTAGLISLPKDMTMSEFLGYVKYRKDKAFTIQIEFQYAGDEAYDAATEVSVEATTGVYFSNGNYFSDGEYYGAEFTGRLLRQIFEQQGDGKELQAKIKVETSNDFKVNELGFRFEGEN